MKSFISKGIKLSRTYRKRAMILILVIIVVLSTISALFLYLPKPTKAAWFDDMYAYRQKITIGNSGAADADKKVKFDIDTATLVTAGKMQSDCDDTRFTDASGKLLMYFLDTSGGACNGASTDYYVLYNTINAGNTDIYMYYGNPAANIGSQSVQFSQTTFSPTSGPTQAFEEKGTGPIAYWRLDEGVDNTCSGDTNDVCNATGNTSNDGAISNGTAWKTEDLCVSGKCLWFDGSNDVVTVSNNNSIDFDTGLASAVTFETWFKANSDGEADTGQMFQKGTNTYCRVDTESAGSVDVECSLDLGTTDATLNITAPVTTNSWNHLVMGYTDDSDDEITIWINGINKGSSTKGVGSPATSDTNDLLIGGVSTANFHGFIDDFKIYNYERSEAQIKTDYLSRGAPEGAAVKLGANYDNNPPALSSGLLGYWKLDQSSWNGTSNEVVDSSGNALHGTAVNGATTGVGKFGNGGNFDGTNDYVAINDNSLLEIQGDMTVSVWVKFDTISAGAHEFVYKNHTSSPFVGYELAVDGDEFFFQWVNTDGTFYYAYYTLTPTTGTWYHVVGVKSGNRSKLYVNGVNDPSKDDFPTGTLFNTDDKLDFGASEGNNATDGIIDDIRLYNRALSNSDIASLYNWAPGPIAYYNFDENTGTTTAYDRSGNGNNGTINGSMTSANWVPGVYGSALDFDGTDDYVSVGTSTLQQITGDVSVGAWFKADVIANSDSIIYMGAGAGETAAENELYILRWNNASGNDIEYKHESGSGSNSTALFNTNLSTGVWYHAMIVRDEAADVIRLYVNGVQLDTGKVTATDPTGGTSSTLNIGHELGGTYVNGQIDEVKIYNYARTAKQVVEDMNAAHPAGGSPFGSQTFYYKFDEQQGTVVNNTASNLFTEAVGGGALWKTAGSSSCKMGGCLDFDGVNDVVTIANTGPIDMNVGLGNGFTVSAWIYADSDGETDVGRIFDKANTYLRVDTESGGRVDVEGLVDLATTDATLNISSAIALGTWNYVAMTWTNDTDDELSIYINGVLQGTSTDGSGDPASEGAQFEIAGTPNFDGRIDSFKLYNAELSAADILIDMNSGSAAALGGVLGTQDDEGFGGSPTVGYWNLDENSGTTSVFDISGNNNTGTMTNIDATDWIPGKYGSALDLDGVDEHITRADDADFDFAAANSFTVEAWIKHTTQSSGQDFIVTKFASAGYKLYMESDGDVTFGIDDDGVSFPEDSATSTAATYDDNLWHHVVGVKNGTTSIQLYIDGILIATDSSISATNTLANTDPIYFGIDEDGTSNAWLGQIDDVRIYNTARSQAQIAYDYNRGAPLAYYKLDECQTTTAYNSAPAASGLAAGMNGTITPGALGNTTAGNCGSGTSTEMWDDGTTGKRNASLGFDSADDYVTIADTNLLDITGDFTISAWVFRNGSGGMQIVSKTNDSTDGGYAMLIGSAGELYCRTNGGSSSINSLSDTGFITNSSGWRHAVVVRSGTSCKVYIDGEERTSSRGTHTTLTANANNLIIGGRPNLGGEFWGGLIDDVRIYNYAVSSNQVKQIYNNGAIFFGPSTGTP